MALGTVALAVPDGAAFAGDFAVTGTSGPGLAGALLVGGAYRETELTGFSQSPELVRGRQPFLIDGPTFGQVLSRQRRFTDYESSDMTVRAEISGTFSTGGLTPSSARSVSVHVPSSVQRHFSMAKES